MRAMCGPSLSLGLPGLRLRGGTPPRLRCLPGAPSRCRQGLPDASLRRPPCLPNCARQAIFPTAGRFSHACASREPAWLSIVSTAGEQWRKNPSFGPDPLDVVDDILELSRNQDLIRRADLCTPNVEVPVGKSPETVSPPSMTTTLSTLLEKPSSIRRRVVISRASPLRLSVVVCLAAGAWAAVIPGTTL